jgi:hypothetical protein
MFLVLVVSWLKNIFASLQRQARLAQSVERTALNRVVVGSSPTVGVFLFCLFPFFVECLVSAEIVPLRMLICTSEAIAAQRAE